MPFGVEKETETQNEERQGDIHQQNRKDSDNEGADKRCKADGEKDKGSHWWTRLEVSRQQKIFHQAAEKGHWKLLETLRDKGLVDLSKASADSGGGSSMLVGAIKALNHAEIDWLLSSGVDVNVVLPQNRLSALHFAVGSKETALVERLLKAEADVNQTSLFGDAALHIACKQGSVEISQMLLQYGADVRLQNKAGNTSLHLAAREGHTLLIERLAPLFEPSVDQTNMFGLTPIMVAAEADHWGTVEAMIQHLAPSNLNTLFPEGRTLLHLAVSSPANRFVVDLLLRSPSIDPNALDHHGLSPLVRLLPFFFLFRSVPFSFLQLSSFLALLSLLRISFLPSWRHLSFQSFLLPFSHFFVFLAHPSPSPTFHPRPSSSSFSLSSSLLLQTRDQGARTRESALFFHLFKHAPPFSLPFFFFPSCFRSHVGPFFHN